MPGRRLVQADGSPEDMATLRTIRQAPSYVSHGSRSQYEISSRSALRPIRRIRSIFQLPPGVQSLCLKAPCGPFVFAAFALSCTRCQTVRRRRRRSREMAANATRVAFCCSPPSILAAAPPSSLCLPHFPWPGVDQ